MIHGTSQGFAVQGVATSRSPTCSCPSSTPTTLQRPGQASQALSIEYPAFRYSRGRLRGLPWALQAARSRLSPRQQSLRKYDRPRQLHCKIVKLCSRHSVELRRRSELRVPISMKPWASYFLCLLGTTTT